MNGVTVSYNCSKTSIFKLAIEEGVLMILICIDMFMI